MDTQLKQFFGGVEDAFDVPPIPEKQVGGDHYLKAIQPWDIIRAWGLGYWRGNVVKYILRAPYKNGKEDLEKALHYIEYLIENYDSLDPEKM